MSETQPIRIGISACLLGEPVRYDGGHKRLPFADEELRRHFEFINICPEQAIGMGVPRPTIRLVGDPATPQLIGSSDSSLNVTDAMQTFAKDTVPTLTEISGYILCAKSPSCGMERVPVYDEQGNGLGKIGVGLYAKQLMAAHPLLPVEENGRLNDVHLRENFVLRVVAYARWQRLINSGISASDLEDFHRRHKFLLLAHNQTIYRELGPIVAEAGDISDKASRYISKFMAALKHIASTKNHTNTLMHIQGFFKDHLDAEDKLRLTGTIKDYAAGQLPLLVPLEMLSHYLKKYRVDYLLDQYYFDPYPRDLKLRMGL
ncbi:YbgA family protein [Zhongshania sp.]|uniref:YbgA family protein n=1 Tax=Zhongshania sp. TaxID=1971902 RepID=UPI00356608B4